MPIIDPGVYALPSCIADVLRNLVILRLLDLYPVLWSLQKRFIALSQTHAQASSGVQRAITSLEYERYGAGYTMSYLVRIK